MNRLVYLCERLQTFQIIALDNLNEDYNLGQNICKLFPVLAQFLFTTSETELDQYHQKLNIQNASRDQKRLKT